MADPKTHDALADLAHSHFATLNLDNFPDLAGWQSQVEVDLIFQELLALASDFTINVPDDETKNGLEVCHEVAINNIPGFLLRNKEEFQEVFCARFGIIYEDAKDIITGEPVLPTKRCLWFLVQLIRRTDTPSCYFTQNLLRSNGSIINPNHTIKVRPFYMGLLSKMANIFAISSKVLLQYDCGIRMARASFLDPSCTVTTQTGRSGVILGCRGEARGEKIYRSAMFEVTRTSSPCGGAYEGPQCGWCGTFVVDLFLCNRCRKVRYCSREHQREDWKRHKPTCKHKPFF
jgi:hypothetical protein